MKSRLGKEPPPTEIPVAPQLLYVGNQPGVNNINVDSSKDTIRITSLENQFSKVEGRMRIEKEKLDEL
ncbi:hypothetical protein HDU76_005640 [Blyttiomyces sp. JEL0837]|nr:hypothetical protein HDU76_005640 [Blyttiomyces sp. JEL0837]